MQVPFSPDLSLHSKIYFRYLLWLLFDYFNYNRSLYPEIHDDDDDLSKLMDIVGEKLNLLKHLTSISDFVAISGPGDIEGHKSNVDGLFYVVGMILFYLFLPLLNFFIINHVLIYSRLCAFVPLRKTSPTCYL